MRQVGGFYPGTPVSSTNNSDRHDITEILLKVTLSTINLSLTYILHAEIWSKMGIFINVSMATLLTKPISSNLINHRYILFVSTIFVGTITDSFELWFLCSAMVECMGAIGNWTNYFYISFTYYVTILYSILIFNKFNTWFFFSSPTKNINFLRCLWLIDLNLLEIWFMICFVLRGIVFN